MRCTRWSSSWRRAACRALLAVTLVEIARAARARRAGAADRADPVEGAAAAERAAAAARRADQPRRLALADADGHRRLARSGEHLRAFLLKYLDANWDEWLAAALISARIGGSILLTVVGYVVLVPVVLFYLLADWPFYMLRAIDLVPPRLRGSVAAFTDECDTVLGQYLRGQLLVMLLHGRLLQRRSGAVRLRPRGAGRRLHRAWRSSSPTSASASA